MARQSEAQPEIYFNVESGALLVGKLAVEADIEAGAYETDIYPLPELLAGPERIVGAGDFRPGIPFIVKEKYDERKKEIEELEEAQEAEEAKTKRKELEMFWDPDFDVPTAKWLHGVVKHYAKHKVLSMEVLRRASFLNLIPSENYFRRRPGGSVGLYRDAKLENTRSRSSFDHWTIKDHVDHIRKLARIKHGKPTIDDLWAASSSPDNPSPWQIKLRIGLDELYELAGFYQTRNKSRDDLIDWGVCFMEANNGKIPTKTSMAILSALKRGPSPSTIDKRPDFDSMYDFQTECFFAYERKMQYKKQLRETQLEDIDSMLPDDTIMRRLAEQAVDEDNLVRMYAKYKLIREFVTLKRTNEIISTCRAKSTSGMVSLILNNTEDVTTADIEAQAEILGLHDTIWPMDHHLRDLKVA